MRLRLGLLACITVLALSCNGASPAKSDSCEYDMWVGLGDQQRHLDVNTGTFSWDHGVLFTECGTGKDGVAYGEVLVLHK